MEHTVISFATDRWRWLVVVGTYLSVGLVVLGQQTRATAVKSLREAVGPIETSLVLLLVLGLIAFFPVVLMARAVVWRMNRNKGGN